MLVPLQKFALKFAPAKTPIFVLLILMLVVLGLILVFPGEDGQDLMLIPAILLFVWLLLFFSFLNLFARVPEPPGREAGMWQRLVVSVKRGFYYLFALFITIATVGVLVTTYQLSAVWVRMYIL